VQLSVLVVSRTAERLSTLLSSVSAATRLSAQDVEILCSWNGSEDDEQLIENHSGYEFFIAQRKPYHFASNINQLANHASGDVVALVNDDVVLDPGSLDAGLACLSEHPPATMVGGLLRTPDEQLQHAGFSFELNHNPYHILEGMIAADDFANDQTAFEVPAVTAAVALIPRQTFLQLSLNENYQRCGEDVEFNLDLRQKLNGHVFLCPGLSGVHAESATRAEQGETGNTSEDQVKLRTRRRHFVEQASADQLRVELAMTARERTLSRHLLQQRLSELDRDRAELERQQAEFEEAVKRDSAIQSLQNDRDYWKRQAQTLQLEALRLQDSVQRGSGV